MQVGPRHTKAVHLKQRSCHCASDILLNLASSDLRLAHLRQCKRYPHHFRSMVLNSKTKNMPIKQLYPPADICSMTQIRTIYPEERFLQSLGLSNITQTEQTG